MGHDNGYARKIVTGEGWVWGTKRRHKRTANCGGASWHDRTRHPAAPGYSEKQLEGRVLETLHPAVIPSSIGAVAMFMAILPMPYEFYVLLRWVGPAVAIWTVAGGQKKTGWVAVFALVTVLWNPLLPVEMPRSSWVFLNVAGLALFAAAGAQLKASKPALRTHHAKSL